MLDRGHDCVEIFRVGNNPIGGLRSGDELQHDSIKKISNITRYTPIPHQTQLHGPIFMLNLSHEPCNLLSN
jgi:hypothetical protein